MKRIQNVAFSADWDSQVPSEWKIDDTGKELKFLKCGPWETLKKREYWIWRNEMQLLYAN